MWIRAKKLKKFGLKGSKYQTSKYWFFSNFKSMLTKWTELEEEILKKSLWKFVFQGYPLKFMTLYTGCFLIPFTFEMLISQSKNGWFWSNLCLMLSKHSTICELEEKYWENLVKKSQNGKIPKIAFLWNSPLRAWL